MRMVTGQVLQSTCTSEHHCDSMGKPTSRPHGAGSVKGSISSFFMKALLGQGQSETKFVLLHH